MIDIGADLQRAFGDGYEAGRADRPNNKVHLCDSCQRNYPDCSAEQNDVIFGDGTGNDNICYCAKYEISDRPTGKWVKISPAHIYECSVCGQIVMTDDIDCYSYCHNCGARMDDEKALHQAAETIEDMSPKNERQKLSNREWKEFLSRQFDISKTSAKEMLHGMMRWKKEDNFKRIFNPIRERSRA